MLVYVDGKNHKRVRMSGRFPALQLRKPKKKVWINVGFKIRRKEIIVLL